MSEQSPEDLGAAANLLLVITVLLAIVGTGVMPILAAAEPRTDRGTMRASTRSPSGGE
jgi:hypothetical protein